MQETSRGDDESSCGVRVAFLGNSILYFNDCPRMFKNLAAAGQRVKHQDSCLRGGTNLAQLWEQGNGMRAHGFKTDAAKTGEKDDNGVDHYDIGMPTVGQLLRPVARDETWDFVVINDHTQGPCRNESRRMTQEILVEKYLPLIRQNNAVPIIIETAAYRYEKIVNSEDLGTTHQFQRLVMDGVNSYVSALEAASSACKPRVAPVGSAYLLLHDKEFSLWEDLFDSRDFFHPSPIGTFLQACVLHCTMFGCPPAIPRTEDEITSLWRDARVMHTYKGEDPRRLPTVEEAEVLVSTAARVCGLDATSKI
ncbi:hypothetical protein THAOC_14386 [Thalassiosira oceanica]|uniref:SGNH hydrolase-type esterase domain-containing protein n=1 Tax=Thalassiosira oceanica TaxID=159749 RepID=K0SFD8_THAOC|nr:hypothetical protein THAOC_14386 [Thalassiosira oceanica]|eukprot:EJK64838.1 hypothetical protein THAOC_14386 [Thalassiosira oceanica]